MRASQKPRLGMRLPRAAFDAPPRGLIVFLGAVFLLGPSLKKTLLKRERRGGGYPKSLI